MDTNIAQDKTDAQIFKERAQYITNEYGSLVGKTILVVRPLMKQECDALAWQYGYERDAMVVIFTDGTAFIPMQDPEGNGAGFLALVEMEGMN